MNSIFQTKEWEDLKLQTGYQKRYRLEDILVLQKNIAFGRTMLYSPRVSEEQLAKKFENGEKTKIFFEKIKDIAKKNKSIFYRLELDIPLTHNSKFVVPEGFVKSFEEMQPEHTLVLDISKSEEEILKQMKQKGRYNIKIADKHKVEVKKSRKIDNFYKLYIETAKRQKITFREKQYFQKLIDILEPKGYCEVFEASTEGEVLATAIVTFFKGRSTYLFGSSSRKNNKAMAPYKLHWKIIQDAKERGCREYDFFGVAPENKPNHPWAGVTSFKEKFGGKRVSLMGSYDLILKPLEYKLFKVAEKVRR